MSKEPTEGEQRGETKIVTMASGTSVYIKEDQVFLNGEWHFIDCTSVRVHPDGRSVRSIDLVPNE